MSQITMLNLYSECRDGELLILDTLLSGSKDAVAAVFLDDSPLKDSVAKSLADLFCAAPDMLAVLEELLALGNIRDALDFFSKVQAVIHTDVRSAIAKAKGESA